MPVSIPFSERPSCTVNEALAATGIGLTTLYKLIGLGELEATRVGGSTLIKVPSLLRLISQGSTAIRRPRPPVPQRRHHDDSPEPPEAA